MRNRLKNISRKIGSLLTNYPRVPGVHPAIFASIPSAPADRNAETKPGTLAFQSVPDKFYFLLFGAFRAHLTPSLRGRAELVVVRAVSGAIGTGWLAELKRAAPVAWLLSKPWVRAYGAFVDDVAYWCATWAHPYSDLADWMSSGRLWRQLQQQNENHSLLIDGIEVADLIIDSYLRFKPSPEFSVSDPFVRRLVWQALRDVRQAQAYFGKSRPRLYLTSYTTYLEHGIPARVALQKGVDVWAFGNLTGFGKHLSLSDSYHTRNCSSYRSGFEALDRQTERLQQAREQLEIRLSGNIDVATSYMRQSAYSKAHTELPAGLNGAVVVFLHDFYDSPHIYPELVFHDFWRWICFTIEALQKIGATFFLKPHPNQLASGDDAMARLRTKYPSLQWLPAGTSNAQLAQAGIACGITVYGTVAHELAYLGVPSIGCARHPHHTFDFCRTARTKEEYVGMLKTYETLPVPKEEMQRQALAFYYMHNLHEKDNERELQKAFIAFWRACNMEEATEDKIKTAFLALVNRPAFARFAKKLIDQQEDDSQQTAKN